MITFILWSSYLSSFWYGFHLIIFISKELVDSFSLNILGLMTSLRIANPDGRSATLNSLLFDVENYFMWFFFMSRYFYLGFGIDFFWKDWLNHCEAHILFFEWTIHLRHFQSVKQISIFLYDFDSKLMASFYSLSPLIRKVLFLSFM